MKNKGFTLIELLAVIVILAIIALIATPIILNIINDSKEESDKRSIELYENAVENSISDYMIKNNGTLPSIQWIEENIEKYYQGNKVDCTINYDSKGNVTLTSCCVGDNCEVNNEGTTPSVTYAIGDEIKLPGTTNIMLDDGESCNFQSTLNYTQWNVIDITGDSIKLYSYDGLTNDGNFLRLSTDSIGTAGCYMSFASPNPSTWDISSYYYDSDGDGDGDYTINLPTIGDFTNIITVSGSNYSLNDASYDWFNNIPRPGGGIALNDLGNSTNPYTYYPKNSLYFNLEGPQMLTFRPVITLSKSQIPDQSQFN